MDRRSRNLFVLALGVFVAVTGAAAILLSSTSTLDPDGPPGASQVVGVITHLESTGLDNVTALTVRTTGGDIVDFTIGALENRAELPPGHLALHQTTGSPVRVWYRTEGDVRVAIRIEDAIL
jgi:hypothetical protein